MVELIMTLPWRVYPAAMLMLLGAGLALSGVRRAAADWGRRGSGPEWAMLYLTTFRRVVVGLALVGAGAAWLWQVPELVAASVCIGLGELLESTFYIEVMRWGRRRGVAWLAAAA